MSDQQMTPRELDFYRALMAPFADDEVKVRDGSRGTKLHYIRSRTVQNRLDEVCGPSGYTVEYRPMGENGILCRLTLRVPTRDGGWEWIAKEDGGGKAGMPEDDNDEKSGYSDALKRAGAAWGIGRYLYKDGMPSWMGDAPPPESRPERQESRPAQQGGRFSQRPADQRPAPQQGGRNEGAPTRLPRAGKGPWAFIMQISQHYNHDYMPWFKKTAAENKFPERTDAWSQEQVNVIFAEFIIGIKDSDEYDGFFDGIPNSELGLE